MRICLLLLLCLQSFKVFSNEGVDRADSIIRQVIAKNNYERLLPLKSQAYLKNTLILDKAPKRFLGKRVRKLLKLKSEDRQVLHIHEANSELYFDSAGLIKENITSYKNFGDYKGVWQFRKAADLLLNFNENYVELSGFSDKKFISPIAKNAFRYYDYFYEREVSDDLGNIFYLIKIYPKTLKDPAFYGHVYINKTNLQISKLSLNLRNNAGISLIAMLTVDQELTKIDDVYYPTQTTITYNGGGLGFFFSGTSTAVFNYFSLNEAENSEFKKYEILKIQKQTDESEKQLTQKRPIKLTKLESEAYKYHDSLKTVQSKKSYLDSLDKLSLSQRLYPLLFDTYKIQSSYRGKTFEFDPIIPALFYNTVEGPGIKYGMGFTKYSQKDGSYYNIQPEFRYGFKNKQLNSDLSFSWMYKPDARAMVNLSFGSTYRDLNPNGSLSSVYNSLSTLLFEQNFMKLFRKQYVSISSGREITNGLYFSTGLELSKNISVSNMYDYSFRNIKRRNFTSNNPLDADNEGKLFPDHASLRLSGTLVYTFNHQYVNNEGIKMYEIPEQPRLILSYRKGIPNVFGSETNYDLIEFEVQQEKLHMGLWGYASFSISAGKFLNNSKNFYPDWKHFIGNMALIFNPKLKGFHLLDFYNYSTDKEFIEAHWEHNFNSRFLGSIPIIRKLKLQELAGAAFLTQPDKGLYYEVYLGVKRLGMRTDYAFSFDNDGLLRHRVRFSLNLQSPYKKRYLY